MVGKERISIEAALERAFWSVKVPSMVMLLTPLLTFVLLSKLRVIPTIGMAGLRWFFPCLLVALVGGWLVWSIQIPRWRLWAYRAVDDIDELKMQAMERGLIWPPGHFFERTEIMPASIRRQIRELEIAQLSRVQ